MVRDLNKLLHCDEQKVFFPTKIDTYALLVIRINLSSVLGNE